jgi:hypothetical protein
MPKRSQTVLVYANVRIVRLLIGKNPRVLILYDGASRIWNLGPAKGAGDIGKVARIRYALRRGGRYKLRECVAVEVSSQASRAAAGQDGAVRAPRHHAFAAHCGRCGDVGHNCGQDSSSTKVQRRSAGVGRERGVAGERCPIAVLGVSHVPVPKSGVNARIRRPQRGTLAQAHGWAVAVARAEPPLRALEARVEAADGGTQPRAPATTLQEQDPALGTVAAACSPIVHWRTAVQAHCTVAGCGLHKCDARQLPGFGWCRWGWGRDGEGRITNPKRHLPSRCDW